MAADFKVQRGVTTFGASADTADVTITAVGGLTKAFARITGVAFTTHGRTAGQSSDDPNRDFQATCRLTSTTNVQFERNTNATNVDFDVFWEVWEYTGPVGASSEMYVHVLEEITLAASATSGNGTGFTPDNSADVVPFITGCRSVRNAEEWGEAACTAEVDTSSGTSIKLTRGTSTAAIVVSYAAVEFKGSDWSVQTASHTFSAAGANETETISDVGSWADAFIVGSWRVPEHDNEDIMVNYWPGSGTTTVRFRLRSGADSPGSTVCRVFVVKNTQLNVQHSDSITGSGTDHPVGVGQPQTINVAIASALSDITLAGTICSADVPNASANYPCFGWNYRITSTTNVEWKRSRTNVGSEWAQQVIDFAAVLGVRIISPSGIASSEAFGTAAIKQFVTPTGIASIEAFGTAAIKQTVAPSGIASAEAFGTATVTPSAIVSPTGIASAEAFGTATVTPSAIVSPTGIASAEAFGTATVTPSAIVSPTGIASDEAFGTATVTPSAIVSPTGIASGEAFGTATVTPSAIVSPTGIASGEAFGTPTVSTAASISPSGIASEEAFGTPQLNQFVAPSGIASAEALGTPSVVPLIQPSGIASDEAFGTPSLVLIVNPSGIASSEAFGTATVTPNAIVSPTGIASDEAFGTPIVTTGTQVFPTGIASEEAFGTATVTPNAIVSPSGIASAEAFGTPSILLIVAPAGIASQEALGTPSLVLILAPSGIASQEAFGTPSVVQLIAPTGIASGEAFGTATVALSGDTISPAGIASEEAFGTAMLVLFVSPNGIASGEAFGTPMITTTLLRPIIDLIAEFQQVHEFDALFQQVHEFGE